MAIASDNISSSASNLILPATAPATGRGVCVQLGKATGVNLNNVAATTIFTTPASGFTRCIVMDVVGVNFSGAATTNAISFGASATPTDWMASNVIPGTMGTGKYLEFSEANNTAAAVYGPGVAFVVNVTAGGTAITGDFEAWGWYE